MNSLSWWLYIIDVLDDINVFLFFAMFIGSAVTGFVFFFSYSPDVETQIGEHIRKKLKYALYGLLACIVLGIAIPSQKTMFLIIGSELSGQVVTTDELKKVRMVVNKKLDEYLQEDKSETR